MTDTRYKISMDGSLTPGATLDAAQERVAQLFKTNVSSVKQLFSGKQVVIKRDISEAEADKYVQALFQAGVIAQKETDLAASLTLESIETEHDNNSNERMTCPKCASEQALSEICNSCGIVIAKFNHYQAQAKQVSAPNNHSPYASPSAVIAQDDEEVGELNIWGVEGRIGRMRYIAWSMVFMFAMLPAMLIGTLAFGISAILGGLIMAVIGVAAIIIGVQISVKRLHDIGWSGWLLFIALIPFVGSIFQLLIFVMPGSQGSNRFGAAPPENSQSVKVLFWIWLAFMVISIIGIITAATLGLLAGM